MLFENMSSMNTAYNQMGASTPYFAREVMHHHIPSSPIADQQRSFEMQGRDVPRVAVERKQLRARPQVPAPDGPVDGRRDQFGVVRLHRDDGAGVAPERVGSRSPPAKVYRHVLSFEGAAIGLLWLQGLTVGATAHGVALDDAVGAARAEQPPARADVIDVAVTRMMEA